MSFSRNQLSGLFLPDNFTSHPQSIPEEFWKSESPFKRVEQPDKCEGTELPQSLYLSGVDFLDLDSGKLSLLRDRGYAISAFEKDNSHDPVDFMTIQTAPEEFVVHLHLLKRTKAELETPMIFSNDELSKRPFENVPTSAQILMECEKKDGEWRYASPHIIPDGSVDLGSFTGNEAYGIGIFEGMVIETNDKGELFIFRIDQHYKRFCSGCASRKLPVLDQKTFEDSVKAAVLSNLSYIKPGNRLYLRIDMKAQGGSQSVKVPNSAAFTIIAFPFSDYSGGINSRISVVMSDVKRFATPHKSISKYDEIAAFKDDANNGNVGFNGHAFVEALTSDKDGRIQEAGSSNFIAVDKDGNIITPSTRNQDFLDGVTRRSAIALAGKGKVIERDIYESEIPELRAACLTGSAARVLVLSSIGYNETLYELDGDNPDILRLQEMVVDVRSGNVSKAHKNIAGDWHTILLT